MPFVRVLCFFPLFALHAFSFFPPLPSWLLLTLLLESSHSFPTFFLFFFFLNSLILDLPGRGHVRCCWVRRTNDKMKSSLAPSPLELRPSFDANRLTYFKQQERKVETHSLLFSENFASLCWLPPLRPPHTLPPSDSWHGNLAGLFSEDFEDMAVGNELKAKWCKLKPVWTGKKRRLLLSTRSVNKWRSGYTVFRRIQYRFNFITNVTHWSSVNNHHNQSDQILFLLPISICWSVFRPNRGLVANWNVLFLPLNWSNF